MSHVSESGRSLLANWIFAAVFTAAVIVDVVLMHLYRGTPLYGICWFSFPVIGALFLIVGGVGHFLADDG